MVAVELHLLGAVEVLEITAVGFTLTVTFKEVPAQPFTDGVTI